MTIKKMLNIPTILFSLTLVLFQLPFCHGQMEKRSNVLYRNLSFSWSKPYNGTTAPNFSLRTLDNKKVQLKDYFGQPLVIIKAGYT